MRRSRQTAAGPDDASVATQSAVPSQAEGVDEPAFWLPIEEVHWDGTPVRRETRGWLARRRAAALDRRRATRPPKPPRSPWFGLTGLLLLSLSAGFFASVSAEPFWLAVGHGDRGVATVARCAGEGVTLSCRGEFTATGGWTRRNVSLVGVPPGNRAERDRVTARMVGAGSNKAYAEGGRITRHLRWLLGLGMAALCGPAIVWSTGSRRLAGRRARRIATLAGLAAPVLIAVGFLAATY